MEPNSHQIPLSDIEQSNQEMKSLETAVSSIGDAFDHASQMLDDLEQNGMLGPAIRRYAADLAVVVGNVARDLEGTKDEDWAKALIDDAKSQLALETTTTTATTATTTTIATQNHIQNTKEFENKNDVHVHEHATQNNNNNNNNNNNRDNDGPSRSTAQSHCNENAIMMPSPMSSSAAAAITELNEGEIIDAMESARFILLDIEEALKDISEDDAEEIADVALVVAKMFLWGLQSVQKQAVKTIRNHDTFDMPSQKTSISIEMIDDGENNEQKDSQNKNTRATSNPKPNNEGIDEERLRVLWPPIGPAVASVASWGKEEATKNPILSVALAMALWPAALLVAFIGVPFLAMDFALQSGYNAMENQPLIKNMEKGAANLYQVGKLYFLISKLFVKQSIRVGKRQIQRRGGIEQIAQDVSSWTIDRALHPIETAGMAINAIKGGTGLAIEAISFVKDVANGNIQANDSNYYHLAM